MTTQNKLELLSIEFSNVLKSWLTEDEMKEVIRRNQLSAYSNACSTHDFCDPNMAMFEAFQKALGIEFEFGNDEHSDLFNGAWHKAKTNNFYL